VLPKRFGIAYKRDHAPRTVTEATRQRRLLPNRYRALRNRFGKHLADASLGADLLPRTAKLAPRTESRSSRSIAARQPAGTAPGALADLKGQVNADRMSPEATVLVDPVECQLLPVDVQAAYDRHSGPPQAP
jgi:hypothetical protein